MFESYTSRVKNFGSTNGQSHKTESDMIMNETWWDDIQSRVAYIYDFYHDNDPYGLTDRHPEKDPLKTPIDIKFIITQYPTLSKDQPEYHIQFRPGQKKVPTYYKDSLGRFGAQWPIGLFCDIPNDEGIYNRWLICGKEYANQFVKYSVLPCNYLLHYCYKSHLYDIACVLRLRNSQIVAHCIWKLYSEFVRICWNSLRAVIPKREDEICLCGMV